METDVAQFKKDAVSMATSPKTTQLVHSVIERASLLLCMDTEPGQVRQPAPQPSKGTARCVCAYVCVYVMMLLAAGAWTGCCCCPPWSFLVAQVVCLQWLLKVLPNLLDHHSPDSFQCPLVECESIV